jgi:hypothetical protein
MTRAIHWIQDGVNKIGFVTEDNYSDIGPVVGVAKLGSADTSVKGANNISNLVKAGQVVRLRIRYKEGTKTKSGLIVCSIDKVASAIAGIRGKGYSGGTILSASIPRRRHLG